ncbi:MAG TPA: alpha/beta fold hydrolase [Allosphingosinicella sp.]
MLPLAILLLAACTTRVSESTLLHPVAGGTLAQEALTEEAAGYTVTRHDILAPDGARLHGVHLRKPGTRATILYFGGKGYTIGRYGAWTARIFSFLNVDIFIADHRGYGLSQGKPTIAAMEADALAVYDHVAALSDAKKPIVLHGHSLGSFIAGYIAANRPTAGVVLEGSVSTAEEWVRAATPGAAKAFVKVRIDEDLQGRGNLENVRRIEEPLLLLTGAKDKTTPPVLARSLYAASPLPEGSKSILIVPVANHNQAMMRLEAVAAYKAFLDSLGT